jgi:hypothetical protein
MPLGRRRMIPGAAGRLCVHDRALHS